jgi:hypothetical protein
MVFIEVHHLKSIELGRDLLDLLLLTRLNGLHALGIPSWVSEGITITLPASTHHLIYSGMLSTSGVSRLVSIYAIFHSESILLELKVKVWVLDIYVELIRPSPHLRQTELASRAGLVIKRSRRSIGNPLHGGSRTRTRSFHVSKSSGSGSLAKPLQVKGRSGYASYYAG